MMHNQGLKQDHYQVLGVSRNATPEEIKKARDKVALKFHSDRNPDKNDDRMKEINIAYEVLSDPRKRDNYDNGEEPQQDTEETFPLTDDYNLQGNPYDHNHYAFNNYLFGVVNEDTSDKHLTPGQISRGNKKHILSQVRHTLHLFQERRKELERLEQERTISVDDKKLLDKLIRNEDKLGHAYSIFEGGEKVRLLYDLSLGPDVVSRTDDPQARKMNEIEEAIGGQEGRERLIKHIRVHPKISTAPGIFALRDAGLLNKNNFEMLIDGENESFYPISSVIVDLKEAKPSSLLNQANFEFLIANRQHSRPISKGVVCLEVAGLLNQSYFEDVVRSGERAEVLGSALRKLHEHNFLNNTNRQRVIKLAKKSNINLLLGACFKQMKNNKDDPLTLEKREALQWNGEGLQLLCSRIDEMFAYGINLLNEEEGEDKPMAKATMMLALELKLELKTFVAENDTVEKQNANWDGFLRGAFHEKLHARDNVVQGHRGLGKVIAAVVGAAAVVVFTGFVALIPFGIYVAYSYYKHNCLFGTEREKLRNGIEKDAGDIKTPAIQL